MTTKPSCTPQALLLPLLVLIVCCNLYQIISLSLDDAPSKLYGLSDFATRRTTTIDDHAEEENQQRHHVARLVCPNNTQEEVMYWRDIPQDSKFKSSLQKPGQYLTFEPDIGGFNNIRMSMENAVLMAILTGRTLVLPPKQGFYLLWDKGGAKEFGFDDFFHFDSIQKEFDGSLKVISFQEFLETVAMKGDLISPKTNEIMLPPDGRVNWNGMGENWKTKGVGRELWTWMRSATTVLDWSDVRCVAVFPSHRGSVQHLQDTLEQVFKRDEEKFPDVPFNKRIQKRINSYIENPSPVNASLVDRLAEILADREEICIYNETLQDAMVIHIKGEEGSNHRLLTHFYEFFLSEDWHQNLWMKRFVRDHLRYIDEIQCTAASIIQSIRLKARSFGSKDGSYDAFHIRRGDFQYENMHMSAEDIYDDNTKGIIEEGRTVYIATDEKNSSYFDPLRKHYNLLFLNDFKAELGNLNPNLYGQVDQIVASRSKTFFGAYYSTFTGYIMRLRGYHAQKERLPGYEQGASESFYYTPEDLSHKRTIMQRYTPVRPTFWEREYPIGWRDIDFGVAGLQGPEEMQSSS